MARSTNPPACARRDLLLSVRRAETLTRISDMNARHSKDTIYHNLEMHNQEYALDRETKLKNFAFIKYTDRSELEEQAEKQRGIRGEKPGATGLASRGLQGWPRGCSWHCAPTAGLLPRPQAPSPTLPAETSEAAQNHVSWGALGGALGGMGRQGTPPRG